MWHDEYDDVLGLILALFTLCESTLYFGLVGLPLVFILAPLALMQPWWDWSGPRILWNALLLLSWPMLNVVRFFAEALSPWAGVVNSFSEMDAAFGACFEDPEAASGLLFRREPPL